MLLVYYEPMSTNIKNYISEWRGYLVALLAVAAATIVFLPGRDYFAKGQWALLYLLIIVLVASRSGARPAILAAVAAFLSWNYFFLPPYHTFNIADIKDWLALFIFLIVGLIMGLQTGKLQERETLALTREHETALLNRFSAHLVSELTVNEMADILATEVGESVKAGCTMLFVPDESGRLAQVTSEANPHPVDGVVKDIADWVFNQSKAIGLPHLEGRLSISPAGWPISVSFHEAGFNASMKGILLPLHTATRQVGVLYIAEKRDGNAYTVSEARLLVAIANQAAAFLERKQLQGIAVQADALREADRMKSTFVSSISHELKTPLASVTATVTNLLESDLRWDESIVRSELSAVLGDLERLNDSISSLVDLSRLESSAWNPSRDWYELGEILGTVLSKVPERQRDRIVFMLPDDLPPIFVDYAQWVRVLSNLIENALAYSGTGENVYIGASSDGSENRTWVEDHGPGVRPDEREKVFDKFYRGQASTKVTSGTGLGLAIAKEIVRFHGGRLWVEDAEPHGARFVIALPNNRQWSENA